MNEQQSMGTWKTTDKSLGGRETQGVEEPALLGRIDQYELIRELGGGGFGSVFLARDTVAGVDVAVKGLPPLVRNNAEELERIRENFALVSKLHHPHIAAALHLHPAKEVSYLDEPTRQKLRVLPGDTLMVMAYAPGVTLNKWRRQFPGGKVPVPQALEVCRQIAEALDYAHREKVVHRDVKPSNIMIESRGDSISVKVLDFGLAAEIRSSMSRVSQEKGDTSGTRPYMAPEQWTGRKQDGRTDQYALAVLFYELVSGAVPFASAFDTGDPVIMANVVKAEAPEPLAALTKAQNAALLRALAKDPAQRCPACAEFIAALGGRAYREPQAAAPAGQKALLWLAAVAVIAVVSFLSLQSFQSHKAARAAERAAAEQAAALDAQQRAKAEGLKAEAEAALAAGDLERAGAKIAELDGLGGTRSVASELRQRYESKAGERECNKRYAAASLAREEAQKLAPGQGFAERLKAMEVAWREAEGAHKSQGWGQALSGYDAVLAACRTLTELDGSRRGAEARRGEADKAKTEAEQARADLYGIGGHGYTRAAEAFEKGDFEEAAKAWQEAAQTYEAAKTRALAMQAYAQAKTAFESAFESQRALLEQHGGSKWTAVKEKMLAASASVNDPTEGAKHYRDALAGVPEAVKEAAGIEQAAKRSAALAAARTAKASGEWQRCIDRADEALALEPGNAEALALRREAEGNLVPTLTVVAEAGGREVAAEILDGQRTYAAPHTFALKPDAKYTFTVSMKSTESSQSKRYKPATLALTADWKGLKTERVTLEEVKGPVEGQDWTSPSTGMAFVWIAALKIWVCKYEVTNGEYRKMNPSHDSKEHGGHSLNGDRQPVVYVNFDDAKAYAAWLTERDKAQLGGARYRVISEAEWLACAQCGDGREYPWGRSMPPKYGNYADSALKRKFSSWTVISGYNDGHPVTCDVERSVANDWDIYGIGGNVWEGCSSDASGSSFGAWRGASWYDHSPDDLRCAYRLDIGGSTHTYICGFRVVLSQPST